MKHSISHEIRGHFSHSMGLLFHIILPTFLWFQTLLWVDVHFISYNTSLFCRVQIPSEINMYGTMGRIHSNCFFRQVGFRSILSYELLSADWLSAASLITAMLHLLLSSTIFTLTAHLAKCMPPFLTQPHSTRLSTFFHSYPVHHSNARGNQYS